MAEQGQRGVQLTPEQADGIKRRYLKVHTNFRQKVAVEFGVSEGLVELIIQQWDIDEATKKAPTGTL
jgi:hypothetical protein